MSGDSSLNGNLFVGKDASLNSRLVVGSDVTVNKDLTIKGRLNVQNYTNNNIINTTVNNYQLIVSEDLSLNGRLVASSDVTVNNITVGRGGGDLSTNTVFGTNALSSNTTGSNNTAVGYKAGYAGTANKTGSNNTYVGYQAKANADNYSNSTALGAGATITASNQVVLGTSTETVVIPNQIQMSYTTPPTFTSSHIGYYYQNTIGARSCDATSGVYTILLTITGLVGVYIINIDTDMYSPGSFGGGGAYYTTLYIKDSSTSLSNSTIGWGGTSTNGYANRNASLTAVIKSNNNTITVGYDSSISFSMNTLYYRYIRIA